MITRTIHSPFAASVKGMLGGAADLLGQTATVSSAYSGTETVADPDYSRNLMDGSMSLWNGLQVIRFNQAT